MSLSTTTSVLLGVAGLIALLLGATLGRRLRRHGLGVALDLWLGAVLLRLLLAEVTWPNIGAAAIVVALRPVLRPVVRGSVRPNPEQPPPALQPS